jgi:hypothetical protein
LAGVSTSGPSEIERATGRAHAIIIWTTTAAESAFATPIDASANCFEPLAGDASYLRVKRVFYSFPDLTVTR